MGTVRPKLVAVVGAVALIAGTVACATGPGDHLDQNGDPIVAATTSIWADVVASTACHRIKVQSIIPAGTDTHAFELSIRAADRVLRSSVIFANGLGLERDLHATLEQARRSGSKVVELGPKAEPIEGDPHLWMDPGRVASVVPVIAAELADLGVMEPTELERCAQAYIGDLERLVDEMADEMSDIPRADRKLVSEHRNLHYFADRFDFEVLGEMIDSSSSLGEADGRHLQHLRNRMRGADIHTVFVEAGEAETSVWSFVKDVSSDGDVVPLYIESIPPVIERPDAPDGKQNRSTGYAAMMRANSERVASALGG